MNVLLKFVIAASVSLFGVVDGNARNSLAQEIQSFVDTCSARVGVAVIGCYRDTTVINNEYYPINSVLKLFQALPAALNLSARGILLSDTITIERSDLQPDTWSPMMNDHAEKTISLPYEKIFEYALSQSDNNACDILFEKAASIDEVVEYWHKCGIFDFDIKWNEAQMHDAHSRSIDNCATPLAAARIISRIMPYTMLSSDYNLSRVAEILMNCVTGQARIPLPLEGSGAIVAHKTGTGFSDTSGNPTGINDVAWILCPNGHTYSLAVFIKSALPLTTAEAIIAHISQIVYDYYK